MLKKSKYLIIKKMFNAYIAEQRLKSITDHDYQEINEKYQAAKHLSKKTSR